MVITYFQTPDRARDGIVTIDGTFLQCTGRLDADGASVFAEGYACHTEAVGSVRLLVQCRRTSASTLCMEITAFGEHGNVLFVHAVENVALIVKP